MSFFRATAKASIATLLSTLLVACSGGDEAHTQSVATPNQTAAAGATTAPEIVLAPNAGQQVYEHYCIHCHAAGGGHPGTDMLASLHGADKAIIKGREDLTEDYVKVIVRNGLLEMAPFRPTEISDAELDALAAYVVQP